MTDDEKRETISELNGAIMAWRAAGNMLRSGMPADVVANAAEESAAALRKRLKEIRGKLALREGNGL